MSAFANAVLARLVNWTLYFVADWRKVGEAEAFLASCLSGLNSHSFEDVFIPFDPTADSQRQFNAAATALKRLTRGWVVGKKSANPIEHPARYPMFTVHRIAHVVPVTYSVTVPVLKKVNGKLQKDGTKTKTVERNAAAGIKVTLSASYLASVIEEANATS